MFQPSELDECERLASDLGWFAVDTSRLDGPQSRFGYRGKKKFRPAHILNFSLYTE
jgi:hypothetical protein